MSNQKIIFPKITLFLPFISGIFHLAPKIMPQKYSEPHIGYYLHFVMKQMCKSKTFTKQQLLKT